MPYWKRDPGRSQWEIYTHNLSSKISHEETSALKMFCNLLSNVLSYVRLNKARVHLAILRVSDSRKQNADLLLFMTKLCPNKLIKV